MTTTTLKTESDVHHTTVAPDVVDAASIKDSDPRALIRRAMLELRESVFQVASRIYTETSAHHPMLVVGVVADSLIIEALEKRKGESMPQDVRDALRLKPIVNITPMQLNMNADNGSKDKAFALWREFPIAARSGASHIPKPLGLPHDAPIETVAAIISEAWAYQSKSKEDYEAVAKKMAEIAERNGTANDTLKEVAGRYEVLMCNIIDADGLQLFCTWKINRDADGKVTLTDPMAKFSDAEDFKIRGKGSAIGSMMVH